MAKLSIPQAKSLAYNAGYREPALSIVVAIAMAESGLQTDNVSGPNKDGTYDFGVLQFNSVNPPVAITKTQAFDPATAFQKAFSYTGNDINKFARWTTFTTKNPKISYLQYLPGVQGIGSDGLIASGSTGSAGASGTGSVGGTGGLTSTTHVSPTPFGSFQPAANWTIFHLVVIAIILFGLFILFREPLTSAAKTAIVTA